jgi:hypothetical protein
VTSAAMSVSYDSANNRAALTFPGLPGGVLPDGNWSLLLSPGGVRDRAGNQMTGATPAIEFFVLAADANHDRRVDFDDLVALAQNYNTSGKTFVDGDFNYNGSVDFEDLVILAQRYNTTLPAVAAAKAATSAFSTTRVARPAPVARPVTKVRR